MHRGPMDNRWRLIARVEIDNPSRDPIMLFHQIGEGGPSQWRDRFSVSAMALLAAARTCSRGPNADSVISTFFGETA